MSKAQKMLLFAVIVSAVAVIIVFAGRYQSARHELSALKQDLAISTAAWKETNERKLAVQKELKAAKKNGYAVCQEEYVSGVFSVSFPLRDLHGHLYAFTLIMPLRKKKDVFQPKVLHDIRSQLKTIF